VLRGQALVGGYAYDDEGVPGRSVEIVKDGKLTNLLMSRTPSKVFSESNGHARYSPLGLSVGHASNLILRARTGLSGAALRARLRREVDREGLPYGLVVRRLEDPTITAKALAGKDRQPAAPGTLPNPILVYQLLPDGT
jgi:hypothetical protein